MKLFDPIASLVAGWRSVKLDVDGLLGRGWYPFNPSIHVDTHGTWRAVVRFANYSIPDGHIIAPKGACKTRNVIVELEPDTWRVLDHHEMAELDGNERVPTCASLGYEDVRLFSIVTRDADDLASSSASSVGGARVNETIYGLACALQLNAKNNYPEQVLLTLDASFDVIAARPLRGVWSYRPQKNWMPFHGLDRPQFVYGIESGTTLEMPRVWRAASRRLNPPEPELELVHGLPSWSDARPLEGSPIPAGAAPTRPQFIARARSGVDVKIMNQVKAHPRSQELPRRPSSGSDELRGGGPLLEIPSHAHLERELAALPTGARWLGIAHEMRSIEGRKLYWHTFFACDERGRLAARSRPFKLADTSIEFAAGMMLHGNNELVLSFGTDDHEAHVGACQLSSVLALLRPVDKRGKIVEPGEPLAASPPEPEPEPELAAEPEPPLVRWGRRT